MLKTSGRFWLEFCKFPVKNDRLYFMSSKDLLSRTRFC
ncbi:hypothetical protein appser11_4260 [Actinobacillus pleuropneumoniae serovar 11 str. 56153]|nr:hypothetical protein appser9_4150 [Actinobacillus pleuropneumoniae serovar 9 str. CVJ13261]EFM99135.1 hypothetical protein appser11_4260 [Actinobacillus pleuropneumoniae serovar 11 str. 56153]